MTWELGLGDYFTRSLRKNYQKTPIHVLLLSLLRRCSGFTRQRVVWKDLCVAFFLLGCQVFDCRSQADF